jgi:hypothetical protein
MRTGVSCSNVLAASITVILSVVSAQTDEKTFLSSLFSLLVFSAWAIDLAVRVSIGQTLVKFAALHDCDLAVLL